MGGQACVLYGAAEFSRDTDLAILAGPENLRKLQAALDELQAVPIAVPPFEQRYLDMGLAVHFRCELEECREMRIDVMSKMRGVDSFAALWSRRTTLTVDDQSLDLLSLPDLVQAKKTQRDKDWPMIGRLLEANYFMPREAVTADQVTFWLRELRTARLLIDVASDYASQAQAIVNQRPALQFALPPAADEDALRRALKNEEEQQREADRQYWLPLRAELERLRRAARQG